MRFARLLISFLLAASFLIPTATPQTATTLQAAQYLQKALAVLRGSSPVSDVTLTGTARRIAGSDDDTGTVTLKATMGGSRMDLNLSSGPRSEVQNVSGASPAGTWSGPDGVAHAMAFHNLLTDPAWFFPAFPLSHGLTPTYQVTYVGQEDRNGQTVEHVAISQSLPIAAPPGTSTTAHLSQMDFYIDATTFLPAATTFNIHPDDNMLLDIPVEVRFSDYRVVSGAQVPFHVQKFLTGALLLDLQFSTAAVNTGLTDSSFSL